MAFYFQKWRTGKRRGVWTIIGQHKSTELFNALSSWLFDNVIEHGGILPSVWIEASIWSVP